ATGYRGTVHISSDDGAALLPADFAFGSATSGTKQFSATMATAGAHTLSVADTASSSIRGGLIVQVSPGAAASYQLSSLPATTTAGSPIAVTVTARDAHGNVATGETSSAHFSTGEATDVLPADPAFSAGVLSVSVSLLKAGTRALTVSQVGGSLQAVSANVQVNPAAAASLALGGAGASTAGDAVSFTATAHDAYGNQATGYAAIVHVTSSDGQAVTPADFAAAGGAANFQVTFKTTGLQTVQIGDGSISTSSSVTVSAAAAVSLAVSDVPASANAGDSLPANVTAKDLYGNVAPTYAGTVSFTTDGDGKAALPASYAFTPGDGGRHTFSFALGTTGTWKLGVSDGHFSATSAGTLVSPGAVDRFVIAGLPLSAHAGDALSALITAKDRFGNTATSYAGTLHSVLTDTAAPVVSDKQASAGSATISFTLVTVGKQSIIVSDAAFSSLSSSSELEVTPAAATRYQLATLPAMAVAGQPLTLAALALDDFGNVDT
ncbi:MAG TPA: hypothetical protein VKJ07_05345, partial [Mycobacteriales bacterium]|nr:hypothetical protein [Mycobacteriales bacterium]